MFLAVVALLTGYSYVADRDNNLQLAIGQAKGMNAFYFDSLNTLMLTDGIDDRAILRDKMLEMPGIVDVRVSRGAAINKKYGEGLPGEQAVDELDRRGLAGESIVQVDEVDGQRVITVIEPYRLTEDTRGTDCLECHRRVESGTVGGAVRVTYSLNDADQRALAALWRKLGVISLLFAVGLLVLSTMMNRMIVRPVNGAVSRLRDIAAGDGDLTQTLDERGGDELGELARWFNVFVTKLRNTIDEVRAHVDDLTRATANMDRVTDQTRESACKQRTETDQVAAAMSEMGATVEQVARSAADAAEAATRSRAEAADGRSVMEATIQAIDSLAAEVDAAGRTIQRLEHESDDISVVLDVIGSIAEQTNLLALNAAIEAARAGEQGRGFAVVADEVRTLAERTQQSTQEIQRKIESLQGGAKAAAEVMGRGRQQAGASVEQAGKAGTSLQEISTAIETITTMSRQIAVAADEHSKVSGEMKRSISTINDAAAGTAEDSEQVAAASRELTQIAQHLHSLVGQFRTG